MSDTNPLSQAGEKIEKALQNVTEKVKEVANEAKHKAETAAAKAKEVAENVAAKATGSQAADEAAEPAAAEKASADTTEEPTEESTEASTDAADVNEDSDETSDATDSDEPSFTEQVKKILFGAAGAVHLSPEDVKSFVSKLVEKGEIAQQDGKKLVTEVSERFKKVVRDPVTTAREAAKEAADRTETAFRSLAGRFRKEGEPGAATEEEAEAFTERMNSSIERVLKAMHVATASQVNELKTQLESLDSKLDQIVERTGFAESAQ
ncbi:MAG: hypothetical protein ACYS22_17025 [Planctomycetota bacterium]|jgi:polyhydroxyalkanoate synthesis regulator phasin